MIARQEGESRRSAASEQPQLFPDSGVFADFKSFSEDFDGDIFLVRKNIDATKLQIVITIVRIQSDSFEAQLNRFSKLSGFSGEGIAHQGHHFRRISILLVILIHECTSILFHNLKIKGKNYSLIVDEGLNFIQTKLQKHT